MFKKNNTNWKVIAILKKEKSQRNNITLYIKESENTNKLNPTLAERRK